MAVPSRHDVLGTPLEPPFPAGIERAVFGMGCFWGAERKFWETDGVYTTAVGYAGGLTPNPTYREVCSGGTGHAEVVLVAFDPGKIRYAACSSCSGRITIRRRACGRATTPAPSTGSTIYCATRRPAAQATASRDAYQRELTGAGYGSITTEIATEPTFYYAEDYHQQYLSKNPNGYCGIGGLGVGCPVGVTVE